MSNPRYWESETPRRVQTPNYDLAIFDTAGIFQVARRVPGSDRIAKGIGLSLAELRVDPKAVAFIVDALTK